MSAAVAEKPAETAKVKAPKKELFDLSSIAKISPPRTATDKFSMVLYGGKGYGKTHLLGSIQDVEALAPLLILATEDGTSVLADKYPDVDVIAIEDWKMAAPIISAVAEGNTKYKTVAIDTLPELQELMKAHSTNNGRTPMEFKDWGFIADETIKVVKMLHRSPVNVIFTSHVEKVKDESTGKLLASPYFLGKKSLIEVLKPVDLVCYLGIGKGEDGESLRVLQTKPDGKFDASDRTGKLDEYIPDPDFSKIYAQLTA